MNILEELNELNNDEFGQVLDTLAALVNEKTSVQEVMSEANVTIEEVTAVASGESELESEVDTQNVSASKGKKIALIELIIAMNALYRPGPLSYIPDYIKNRKTAMTHPEKVQYDCPMVKPILENTFGIIVYQEQVMDICRTLAGYTWGRADLVRRAMSKKHQDEIDAEREIFVNGGSYVDPAGNTVEVPGCVKMGIGKDAEDSARIANTIYDKMVDFAKYAFNKSHATAYAITSFYTAWFKLYYPAEYLTAVMNWAPDTERLAVCIADARDFGNDVLPPNINESDYQFKVLRSKSENANGQILFGLSNIKDVGSSAETIIEARNEKPFENFADFLLRSKCNSRATQALVSAGAFDCMGYERAQLADNNANVILAQTYLKKIKDKTKEISNVTRIIDFVEEYDDLDALKERIDAEEITFTMPKKMPTKVSLQKKVNTAKEALEKAMDDLMEIDFKAEGCYDSTVEKLKAEKAVLGVYLTGHPTDGCEISTTSIGDASTKDTSLAGVVESLEVKKGKDGRPYCFFTLSDTTGNINITMWADAYEKSKSFIYEGSLVQIDGNVSIDDFRSSAEDGIEVLRMTGRAASPLKVKAPAITVVFDNVAAWNNAVEVVKNEPEFDAYFDIAEGSPLYWISRLTGLKRATNYKVSPDFVRNAGWKVY